MEQAPTPSLIEHLIRPEIRALGAYHVPDAAGPIKLDAMENPNTWPEDLKSDWLEVLGAGRGMPPSAALGSSQGPATE